MSAARVGRELFGYLIVLLIAALAVEQVLSNRFYQDYDTSRQTSRAAQLAARGAATSRPAAAKPATPPRREPPKVGAGQV